MASEAKTQMESNGAAGYIWVVSSDEHPELICVRSSTASAARKIPFDSFRSRLSLEAGAHLRYYAFVQNAALATESIERVLGDNRVAEQVFMAHPAVAATIVETSGADIQSRRSLFEDSPGDDDEKVESTNENPTVARANSRRSLDELNDEINTSLSDAEALLDDASTWLDQARERGDEATGEIGIDMGAAPLIPGTTPGDMNFDPLSANIGFDRIADHQPTLEHEAEDGRLQTGHRNPLRDELSTEEIVAMEGWILGREARQRLSGLKSEWSRGMLGSIITGLIVAIILVIALNLPAETSILTRWAAAGAVAGAVTWMLWFWRFRSHEVSKWRRIKRDTVRFEKTAPSLSEATARRLAA